MNDEVCHLREIAERRREADELRAKVQVVLQDLETIKNLDDIEAKVAQAIETIAELSQRIEELGQ
jgi:tetrahydromethanopterin S-methyltransferase subunit G